MTGDFLVQLEKFYNVRDRANGIRILQEMLRAIGADTGNDALTVGVDGVYGEGTRAAVRSFQEMYGLPVTGEVDYATWSKMEEIYGEILIRSAVPRGIVPLRAGQNIPLGERSDLVLILQILLGALSVYYDAAPPPLSGVYDAATMESVYAFQRANRLDATGEVDTLTWNRLVEEYNLAMGDSF